MWSSREHHVRFDQEVWQYWLPVQQSLPRPSLLPEPQFCPAGNYLCAWGKGNPIYYVTSSYCYSSAFLIQHIFSLSVAIQRETRLSCLICYSIFPSLWPDVTPKKNSKGICPEPLFISNISHQPNQDTAHLQAKTIFSSLSWILNSWLKKDLNKMTCNLFLKLFRRANCLILLIWSSKKGKKMYRMGSKALVAWEQG